MLFNSFVFIFLFLPLSVFLYFVLNKYRLIKLGNGWLVFCSLIFYGWWNPIYLPLILTSIFFNFGIGTIIATNRLLRRPSLRRIILIIGIAGNILLLGYFKYFDFAAENINHYFGGHIPILSLVLPLGISFFTFTQIAYLVDAYKGVAKEYDLLNYMLFVSYFPHLLAGPILHHKEMMPQFSRLRNKLVNYKNLSLGTALFFVGLFKKNMIADNLGVCANSGFGSYESLTFVSAWVTSFVYSMQIYFDFSGYTDMALGSALMFNVILPINFNSPYKAVNIQDFWRRWHMTLSRFLKDYFYIPLGGNRSGRNVICINLFLTFLVGGIWHGAGWTFIVWGSLHGIAMVVHRIWQKLNLKMPNVLGWLVTFLFVNITWVFFKADNLNTAIVIIRKMLSPELHAFNIECNKVKMSFAGQFWRTWYNLILQSLGFTYAENLDLFRYALTSLILILFVLCSKNSIDMLRKLRPTYLTMTIISLVGILSVLLLDRASEFLYFNF